MTDQWNLQQFLHEMRQEQQEDHKTLSAKVDIILDKQSQHETRIVILENHRKLILWLTGTAVVSLFGWIASLIAG